MINSKGLKPCPFCGSKAAINENKVCEGFGWYSNYWVVSCLECGCKLTFDKDDFIIDGRVIAKGHTKEECIKIWNTRYKKET